MFISDGCWTRFYKSMGWHLPKKQEWVFYSSNLQNPQRAKRIQTAMERQESLYFSQSSTSSRPWLTYTEVCYIMFLVFLFFHKKHSKITIVLSLLSTIKVKQDLIKSMWVNWCWVFYLKVLLNLCCKYVVHYQESHSLWIKKGCKILSGVSHGVCASKNFIFQAL